MSEFDLVKLHAAAATGQPQAQFQLGYALATSNQIDKALRWYERAARGGLAEARREIGVILLYGFGMRADPAGGLAALEAAAEAGDVAARLLIASNLLLGESTDHRDRAAVLLNQATGADHPYALRALAFAAADRGRTGTAATLFARAAALGDERSRAFAADIDADAAGAEVHVVSGADLDLPERPIQVHCQDPYVATCDEVLSDLDCRHLIQIGEERLAPARTVSNDGVISTHNDYRDSSTAEIDPYLEDFWARVVQRRMCSLAGLALGHAEPLTLIHYGPGQQYRPHRDYLPTNTLRSGAGLRGGQRRHTVFVYLNPVEAGGETEFPELGVRIQPQRGRAVIFRNVDDEGRPDPRTLHAGLPVQTGEKWLASLWIRERPLRIN